VNPSYLCFSPCGDYLYAVNELKEYQSEACGSVSAFKVDAKTGELRYLNTKPTGGTDPCHVIVNDGNTHVFVSNFMSGSISVFPIAKDGSLLDASQFIQHTGSGVNKARQASPHAHSLLLDRKNRFAFVPDLGIDKLMVYRTDFDSGKLIPNETPWFVTEPGAGPRHCEFHSGGKFCYLINELACTILALEYDGENGTFRQIQSVPSTLRAFAGDNSCADIHITPNGKYLYGSNRGHDSIITYAIDGQTGLLEYVDTVSCGGKTPRNFTVDPAGAYVLVCNQDSDNIVVFGIDQTSGRLSKTSEISVPTPVCIKPHLI
jgi:6-phosphogluconolactonase